MAQDTDASPTPESPERESAQLPGGRSSGHIPVEDAGTASSMRALPVPVGGGRSLRTTNTGMSVPLGMGPQQLPDSVGKYHLLARIGEGGMAEVFLAISHGPANFNKLIALKLLRPNIAEDAEHAEMFFEEARIAARLTHPNVVQTYDVGEIEGRYFIAMEYLQGQPYSAMHARTKAPPQEMALRILAEALSGLHYAHELTDLDGSPLHLVHRDISPHNVFVTYDGQVKVLDFGIAKTLSREGAATRTGVVKGKIAYMGPEQVGGEHLDRRTDIYAAGVMLWEILAQRRMWKDIPDVTIMLKLVNRQIPSLREAVPDISEELERICLRALAPDVADRYATAAEFQADLEAYLDTKGLKTRPRDIGAFVANTFGEVRSQTLAFIQDRQRALKENGASDTRSGPHPLGMTLTGTFTPNRAAGIPQLPLNGTISGEVTGRKATTSRGPLLGAVAIAVIVAGGATLFAANRAAAPTSSAQTASPPAVAAPAAVVENKAPQPASVRLRVEATVPGARIFVDNVDMGRAPYETDVVPDKTSHTIRAEAPGYSATTEVVAFDRDRSLALLLRKEPPAARGRQVYAAPARPAAAHTAAAPAPAPTPAAPPSRKSARQLDNDNPFEK